MLTDLQACTNRSALAVLLGVSSKELSYTIYKIPDSKKYSRFCISKKNGASRHILAPCDSLKWLQSRLLDILYECEDDLAAASGRSSNLHYGFRRDANIYENAYQHRQKRYVLNLDISDYFDQFNFGRVRGFFIKDRDFALKNDVATVIAQIACFDNKLPQGSPCSPHIANLISKFFDIRMARFLRPLGCTYSRYADDITISTNMRDFPSDVAVEDTNCSQGWIISDVLQDIFSRAGFSINSSKVRMSVPQSRQMVTGLVVNHRPNVTREFYLKTRAMCNSLFKTGSFSVPEIVPGFSDNCSSEEQGKEELAVGPDLMRVLEGRISYIHYIREKWDLRSIREKQDDPTQFWKMLRDFYIFKYFIGSNRPIIITEGPSDIFYVKSAIRQSTLPHPNLIAQPQTLPLLIGIFNFDGNASEILGLTGGSGNIKRFLYLYNESKKRFNSALQIAPAIILIDNDSGGKDVINMINGIYKKDIKLSDKTTWYNVDDHLFLVKTPHIGSKISTTIEDFLPAAVKNVTLNGKTFSSAPKFDTSKHFGKVALSNYVQANAATIDFSGFEELLNGLDAAIAAHP